MYLDGWWHCRGGFKCAEPYDNGRRASIGVMLYSSRSTVFVVRVRAVVPSDFFAVCEVLGWLLILCEVQEFLNAYRQPR